MFANYISRTSEKLKGLVDIASNFTPGKEYGEPHPFDFRLTEETYKKTGFVTGTIQKYVDFVMGSGFKVEPCNKEDEAGVEVLNTFIEDSDIDQPLRTFLTEGLVKGNSFMEIGSGTDELPITLRVLNANNMYVKRDKFGIPVGYTQVLNKRLPLRKEDMIEFKLNEIAHFTHNKIAGEAYGLGVVYPALKIIDNILGMEKDMHKLLSKKANVPTIFKLGNKEKQEYPNQDEINSLGSATEQIRNDTEWVFGANVEVSTIDYGKIGEKFDSVLEHDKEMLSFSMQVPPELLGKANIPEGLAAVRMEAFERTIVSVRQELEHALIYQIFNIVLEKKGKPDTKFRVSWNKMSPSEKRLDLQTLKLFLDNPSLNFKLRNELEMQVADLLGVERSLVEMTPEERKAELDSMNPLAQGEDKEEEEKDKKKPKKKEEFVQETYTPLSEYISFDYRKYIENIRKLIREEQFKNLKAETDAEYSAGYLSSSQINRLKLALDRAFRDDKSLLSLTEDIKYRVRPGDLYKMDNSGNLIVDSEGEAILKLGEDARSAQLARTETVRFAGQGAQESFKQMGLKEWRWVTSYGDRTCPQCIAKNGQVYSLSVLFEPEHPECRCAPAPVEKVI